MNGTGRPSIGLALGSGVGRGWAHIGVLRALERAGIHADVITGTSAGALVGGVYLAGHLDMLADWTLSLNRRRLMRYVDLNFAEGGLIGGRRLTRLLQENIGDLELAALPRPLPKRLRLRKKKRTTASLKKLSLIHI